MTNTEETKTTPKMGIIPEIAISIILQLIPDFDTSHDNQIYRFIRSCDSAFQLATSSQKDILLIYTLNKITGANSSDTHAQQYTSWKDLRNFLIQKYSKTKTLAHLNLELQSMFQKPSESVNEYYLRIDLCRCKIVEKLNTEISDNTKAGRMATTEETALNVFVNGLVSDIGIMLRTQGFLSLSEAGQFAIQEDKIRDMNLVRRTLYKNEAFKPQAQPFSNPKRVFRPSNIPQSTNQTPKICNYCKNLGHVISECRKRAYNNKIKNQNPQQSRMQQNTVRPSRINNLNFQAADGPSNDSETASNHCSTPQDWTPNLEA